MWKCESAKHDGKDGWCVVHDDGRVGLEWTNHEWLARDVARRLNLN